MTILATIVCYFWLAAMVACGAVLGWATVAPLFQCRHTREHLTVRGWGLLCFVCLDCQHVRFLGTSHLVTPRRRVRRAA